MQEAQEKNEKGKNERERKEDETLLVFRVFTFVPKKEEEIQYTKIGERNEENDMDI